LGCPFCLFIMNWRAAESDGRMVDMLTSGWVLGVKTWVACGPYLYRDGTIGRVRKSCNLHN
jgi:hypothetical protein